jgi:hypothetical protein
LKGLTPCANGGCGTGNNPARLRLKPGPFAANAPHSTQTPLDDFPNCNRHCRAAQKPAATIDGCFRHVVFT